jgi:hypothetical protein
LYVDIYVDITDTPLHNPLTIQLRLKGLNMNVAKASAHVVLLSLLLADGGTAQTTMPTTSLRSAPTKKSAPSAADKAQEYQSLLDDADISSDADVRAAIYTKWVAATCEVKRLKVQQVLGSADDKLAAIVYSACTKRLTEQALSPALSVEKSPSKDAGVGSTALAQVKLACDVPSPSQVFDISKEITPGQVLIAPFPMAPASPPADWIQLNANSSGGEIYTKSTVYVGYINRLRYTASLGGVVTTIKAPTLPSSLFPSITPSKPSTGNRSSAHTADQQAFENLNVCFFQIQDEVVSFQEKLTKEEVLLNETRERIKNQLTSLGPIASSVAEARGAANLSIFANREIPSFPLGDVTRLKALLSQLMLKYAQFSEWAKNKPENLETFQEVSATAAGLNKTLDRYVAIPGTSAKDSGSKDSASPALIADTAPTNNSVSTTRVKSAIATPKPGTGVGTKVDSSGAPDQAAGGSSGIDIPGSIAIGSQEVADYQANKVFIEEWRLQFRRVAGANDDYFIASYKPQCGGWFGQGTSTQMQLTVADHWIVAQKNTPTNLDKVVCQSSLTVTSGLGLSFIPDKTPAFVPGIQRDPKGNPILDSSGNPTIIQTLGYSSLNNS